MVADDFGAIRIHGGGAASDDSFVRVHFDKVLAKGIALAFNRRALVRILYAPQARHLGDLPYQPRLTRRVFQYEQFNFGNFHFLIRSILWNAASISVRSPPISFGRQLQ